MTEAGADGRYYCLTPVLIAAWKRVADENRKLIGAQARASPCGPNAWLLYNRGNPAG